MAATSNSSQALTNDQTRPDVISRTSNIVTRGLIIKGNTSNSPLEFLASTFNTRADVLLVSGNPTVTILPSGNYSISGDMNIAHIGRGVQIDSIMQRDQYLPNVPVGTRTTHRTPYLNVQNTTQTITIETNPFPQYSDFASNENFTARTFTNRDVTAFYNINGRMDTIPLNRTLADGTDTILAFRISIVVFLFQTSTQKFIGQSTIVDFGFGTIFPSGLVDYARNHHFTSIAERRVAGLNRFENGTNSRIQWISQGYNETLGLDVYSAFFTMDRREHSILVSPDILGTSSLELSSVSASSISLGIESVLDEITSEVSYDMSSETNLSNFEGDTVNNALVQDGLVMVGSTISPAPTSPTPSVQNKADLIFTAQAIVLLVIGAYVIKRYKWNK